MADVLVREVEADVLDALKARAAANSRSLNAELQIILAEAARRRQYDARRAAARIRRAIKNTKQTDSAALLREDRRR